MLQKRMVTSDVSSLSRKCLAVYQWYLRAYRGVLARLETQCGESYADLPNFRIWYYRGIH
jgi:hypothetical protein